MANPPIPSDQNNSLHQNQSTDEDGLPDISLSPEDRPYETLILMGEVACNLIDARNPEHPDLVDFEYDHDTETGRFDLFFAPVPDLPRDKQAIAQQMILDFLDDLEELSDSDHGVVYSCLGSISAKSKMDILDMLMEYNQKFEAPLINLCAPVLDSDKTPEEFKTLFNRASEIAKEAIRQHPEHENDLLATSILRPYQSVNDYRANAQLVYNNASPRQITLSTMFILIDEKIKLADRDLPMMSKPTLRPAYILN